MNAIGGVKSLKITILVFISVLLMDGIKWRIKTFKELLKLT